MLIEGYSFIEALYMTVITISTVGYKEVRSLSEGGMYFTSFLIISSLGIFAYNVQLITTFILDGDLRKSFKKIKLLKTMKKMENHVIICGFGRNGQQIAKELGQVGQQFLIIEKEEALLDSVKQSWTSELNFYEGDATHDHVLINAGIESAVALVTTLPEDADNLFVVLTARGMNNNLLIISRASNDSSDKKLRMAGANNVVMPDKVGGSHMASLVIKPDVVEFFNHLSGQDSNVSLEELSFKDVPEEFQHKSIKELHIRDRCGANVVGLKSKDGKYSLNPAPETIIEEGVKLFVLGTNDQIVKLSRWE